MTADDRLISKPEAARFFGVTPRSIDNWEKRGRLPKAVRLPNRRKAWTESALRKLLEQPETPQAA
jgi:predicted DNA-binding transcriptional regulator AlpA